MSRYEQLNLCDKYRQCELCKSYVLKSRSCHFGILQNCENVFCLECARSLWKEETLSKRTVAKVGFYVCPICRKKSYMLAASCYWVANPKDKQVFFDDYFKSSGDFICEFCNKTTSNCTHSVYNEDNPFFVLKFGMGSNYPLSPGVLLDCSQAGKLKIKPHFSPILEVNSYPSSVLNCYKSTKKKAMKIPTYKEEKYYAPETSTFEIDVFSAEDFPFLEKFNTETAETFSPTTERGETGRKLYSQVSWESEFKNQIEYPPVIHLPSEYNKKIPDDCRIETDSSLPFLPEYIAPIYTVKELKANYDKKSLKAMNLHHVFRKTYKRQNTVDLSLHNCFQASEEMFSIRFSSNCLQEDSNVWSNNRATESSTLSHARDSVTEQKYPALRKYLAQLERIPSEKNNPLIPLIKSTINFSPASQDQMIIRVEGDCTSMQNFTSVPHVEVIDNSSHLLNMESQSIDASKVIHIVFQKQLENVQNHKESETRDVFEENVRNPVNTESPCRQSHFMSNSEEASQSNYKPYPVSFSSSIQTLSEYLTTNEFQFAPKYNSANNDEMKLRSELEESINYLVRYLQNQPINNSFMKTDYKTHCQDENYFITNYLHPYKQIRSIRCKTQNKANDRRNSIRYHHIELDSEGDFALNAKNAEALFYNSPQRKSSKTYSELYPDIEDSSELLSRLQASYNETQTAFYREEMSRFDSAEIPFGNKFPQNCNVQSWTESPEFPSIQNALPLLQNHVMRRQSNINRNSKKRVNCSETACGVTNRENKEIQ